MRKDTFRSEEQELLFQIWKEMKKFTLDGSWQTFYKRIELDSQQILSLYSSPVLAVRCPADCMIVPTTDTVGSIVFNTTSYSNEDVWLKHQNADKPAIILPGDSLLGATVTKHGIRSQLFTGVLQGEQQGGFNEDLYITANQDPISGDGTAVIHLFYRILEMNP